MTGAAPLTRPRDELPLPKLIFIMTKGDNGEHKLAADIAGQNQSSLIYSPHEEVKNAMNDLFDIHIEPSKGVKIYPFEEVGDEYATLDDITTRFITMLRSCGYGDGVLGRLALKTLVDSDLVFDHLILLDCTWPEAKVIIDHFGAGRSLLIYLDGMPPKEPLATKARILSLEHVTDPAQRVQDLRHKLVSGATI